MAFLLIQPSSKFKDNSMKVIFLDIDGVLNKENWMLEKTAWIDEEKLSMLSSVIKETDAKIVMTSNWREVWNEPMFYTNEKNGIFLGHKLFEKYEIPIVGFTEIFGKREDEIRKYLADHMYIEKYAVVDDKDLNIDNFVRTDKRFGLTKNDII